MRRWSSWWRAQEGKPLQDLEEVLQMLSATGELEFMGFGAVAGGAGFNVGYVAQQNE